MDTERLVAETQAIREEHERPTGEKSLDGEETQADQIIILESN